MGDLVREYKRMLHKPRKRYKAEIIDAYRQQDGVHLYEFDNGSTAMVKFLSQTLCPSSRTIEYRVTYSHYGKTDIRCIVYDLDLLMCNDEGTLRNQVEKDYNRHILPSHLREGRRRHPFNFIRKKFYEWQGRYKGEPEPWT
jgi:hypothetical protein